MTSSLSSSASRPPKMAGSGTASLTSSATTTIRWRRELGVAGREREPRVAEIRDNPGVGWIDDDVPGGDLVGVDGVEPVTERRLRAHDLEGEDAVGRVHRDRVSRRKLVNPFERRTVGRAVTCDGAVAGETGSWRTSVMAGADLERSRSTSRITNLSSSIAGISSRARASPSFGKRARASSAEMPPGRSGSTSTTTSSATDGALEVVVEPSTNSNAVRSSCCTAASLRPVPQSSQAAKASTPSAPRAQSTPRRFAVRAARRRRRPEPLALTLAAACGHPW